MKRLACLILAAALAAPAWAADDSLYRALGERSGIKALVADFVARVAADARISESFKDIDIPNLKQRLEEQFCELGGGPCVYKGKDMKTIHDGLNITVAQFNALAEDLQLALSARGVPNALQNKLIAKLAPMQRDIVTK
ncbi:group 1 truncated hemoglobin [Massilia sp. TS11]|uniref:group I truncated hemoglobin n=1 Tax=Massilia sp. TS11 TaxID=2908003 RepID=UPI001EDA1AB0|nr:group 1 truncated hemoglobin [Massilia sp. TS11]MCG2585183.1 group 1 truncated hemoglobin [Massilia sp. TS11]